MQIRYLSHYAEYPADWVTHPRLIAGGCSVSAAPPCRDTFCSIWFLWRPNSATVVDKKNMSVIIMNYHLSKKNVVVQKYDSKEVSVCI